MGQVSDEDEVTSARTSKRSVAVFDLGGVLIDWNPRYLYRQLFNGDEQAMEHFLSNICSPAWNEQQDAGRSFAEGCASLKAIHPQAAQCIDAWFERYDEMLAGPIQGTVDILGELLSHGVPLYALSNWSAETFPFAQNRFEFLGWFDGIMLSGKVGLVKPDPRFFQVFLESFSIDPANAVFVDDLKHNIEAATAAGLHGIVFTGPDQLRRELAKVGLLGDTVEHSRPTDLRDRDRQR
jgi:2-haloacid dehalogenase